MLTRIITTLILLQTLVPTITYAKDIDQDTYTYSINNVTTSGTETYVVERVPKDYTRKAVPYRPIALPAKIIPQIKNETLAVADIPAEPKKPCPPCPTELPKPQKLTIPFELGKWDLIDYAKNKLNTLPILKTDEPIIVTGYTCPLGGMNINKKLAQKRADAVETYLKKKHITNLKIYAKPKTDYLSTDEYSLDRRVELIYTPAENKNPLFH
jgi:outer membrane protein OmpA-like peptidoglycan-associated protein